MQGIRVKCQWLYGRPPRLQRELQSWGRRHLERRFDFSARHRISACDARLRLEIVKNVSVHNAKIYLDKMFGQRGGVVEFARRVNFTRPLYSKCTGSSGPPPPIVEFLRLETPRIEFWGPLKSKRGLCLPYPQGGLHNPNPRRM